MLNVLLFLWCIIFKCIIRKFFINVFKGRYFFFYGLFIGMIVKIVKIFSVKELLMYLVCSCLLRINNSNLVRGLLLNIEGFIFILKFFVVLIVFYFEEKIIMFINVYFIFCCNFLVFNLFILLKK